MSWTLPFFDSRSLRWATTLLWTIFLTILLLQPETQSIIPTGIQPAPPSIERELFFSTIHLIMFGITAFLWCLALETYFELRLTLVSVGLFIISYGFVTELAQGMIPGRAPQIWDMIANAIGVMIGIAVYWHWQKFA
jgi:VanZ family protein